MATILIIRNHKTMWRCLLSEIKEYLNPKLLEDFYVIGSDDEDLLSIISDNDNPHNRKMINVSNIPITNSPSEEELSKAIKEERALNIIVNPIKAYARHFK